MKDVVPLTVAICERQMKEVEDMMNEMKSCEGKHLQMLESLKQV